MRLRDLGTEGFRWSDLRAIAKHLPNDSAYWRTREPERSRWGVAEYLLAINADELRWLAWSKTKAAKNRRNQPKPIPRPGDGERAKGRLKDAQPTSLDQVKRLLKMPRRKANH